MRSKEMDSAIKIILTIILPIMVVLSFAYGTAYFTMERTMTSEYEYEVNINPAEDIENVSITVPFPSNLSEGSFSHQEEWTEEWITEIDEEENNLVIDADFIPAGINSTLYLSLESDEEIDTQDPLDGEPVLDPRASYREVERDNSSDSDPEKCYRYSSIVRITYDAEEDIDIEIYIELSGTNSWWMLEDLENQYHDRIYVEVEGEGNRKVEGLLRTGIGDY